jgi:VanZ family protein
MNKWIYWLPALAMMGLIFYLSSRTGDELKSAFPFIPDFNPGHLLAYFILGSLIYYALTLSGARRPGFWAVFLCALYGLTDEYHQSFVPGRAPELRDLINDTTGAILAVVLIALAKKRSREKAKRG